MKEVENSVTDIPSILLAAVITVIMVVTVVYVIGFKIVELVTKTPTSKRFNKHPTTIVGVYFKVLRDAFGK